MLTSLSTKEAVAAPVQWVGEVQVIHTQVNSDPNNPLRFIFAGNYELAPTATDSSETTFSASYDYFIEEYTTVPERRLVYRQTGIGFGDGVGGAITVSFTPAAPAPGYYIGGSPGLTALFQITIVTEHFLPQYSRHEVTQEILAPGGGAYFESPLDDQWVLQGSQVNSEWCLGTFCVKDTTSYRLRRANCAGAPDTDGDGLDICQEFDYRTDPDNPDTDGGGVWDGAEVANETDPNDPTDDYPNQPPVATNVEVTTLMGTAVDIDIVATDPDGDEVRIEACASGTYGDQVSWQGMRVTYTPATGFQGTVTFGCIVADPHGATDVAFITVTVVGAPLTIHTQYEFYGYSSGAGGSEVTLTGDGAQQVEAVCFDSTWTATVKKPKDSVTFWWNEEPALQIAETTAVATDFLLGDPERTLKTHTQAAERVTLRYCTAPTLVDGIPTARYPLWIRFSVVNAEPKRLEHKLSVWVLAASRSRGPFDLNESKSVGPLLAVAWSVEKTFETTAP